ncbi:MAG: 30S ribosomal protein S4, partial [Chloroflexota bacterium]
MKYTGPKAKLSRRLGIPLTPKAAKVMERKPHPPGEHGRNQQFRRGRQSYFQEQLLEKQRLRAQYNIHERQMVSYYKKANKAQGNTEDNLIQLLESRLDSVVLRGGLAVTIYAARQYVNHGHILVNGRRVNIPSYQVKPGDVVQVRQKSQRLDCFHNAVEHAFNPDYL